MEKNQNTSWLKCMVMAGVLGLATALAMDYSEFSFGEAAQPVLSVQQLRAANVYPDGWPTAEGRITSSFGQRDGVNGEEFHPGVDINAEFGTPVYAAGNGVVEQADWNGGYGRYVRITHGGGCTSAYGHMSELAVQAGQRVAKGDIIGAVGSSGYSTGPHLHFELTIEGKSVDPATILKNAS